MRTHRIYLNHSLSPGMDILLDDRAHNYLFKVLRFRENDTLQLFNGDGNDYDATIIEINKQRCVAKITAQIAVNNESLLHVHLVLGISKGDRMDYAMQKAVELGVAAITPVTTEHSVVKLDDKRSDKKHDHWQGIIISACEQCGRSVVPTLHPVVSIDEFLHQAGTNRLILDPYSSNSLKSFSPTGNILTLLIGPEGGFSEAEVNLCAQHGVNRVSMGPRILRTETAGVAAIAVVQALWGDLN